MVVMQRWDRSALYTQSCTEKFIGSLVGDTLPGFEAQLQGEPGSPQALHQENKLCARR